MKKVFVSLILILTVSIAAIFTGCGQQTAATLEDLAASDANIAQRINKKIEKPEGMKTEIIFSGDSFDVIYSYKDKREDVEEKILVKAFDNNSDIMKESWEEAIDNLEKQTGISGIIGTVIIKNASGDEIWKRDYPEEE